MNKKIIFLAMALMCLANISKAEDINIQDFTITPGESMTVPLQLTNTKTNLTAFEITVEVPAGVTIDIENCALTDRYQGMLEIRNPEENIYRFCGLAVDMGTISGTSGALINISFKAAEGFRGGKGQILDSYFVTTSRERVMVDDKEFKIDYFIPAGSLMGDANGDGSVDISDVLLTVDYVLGKSVSSFIFLNADMDQSGRIDISDVLAIVDKILGK